MLVDCLCWIRYIVSDLKATVLVVHHFRCSVSNYIITIILLITMRMWDMSNCTCMASGDRRFLGNFFDLYFISLTFERKSKVLEAFLDMSLVR